MNETEDSLDWEQCYQQGDTPWEKGAPHPALVAALGPEPGPFDPAPTGAAGDILVPGCGFGHDVVAIARRHPQRRVVGIDIAPSALAAARAAVAGLANAEIVDADLFQPPSSWLGGWGAVFEHTCLSALHPVRRADYARSLRRLLAPGGRLVAVFFINPDMDPGEQGPPFGVERGELDATLDEGFHLVETRFPIPTYEGREQREEWRVYEVADACWL